MLADQEATERPSSYSYEDLLACSRGELFGPGNAQLPAPNMLMMDRITSIASTGGSYNKGEILAQVLPTAKMVNYQINIKRVMARGLVMGIADATMSVDDREIYTAKNLRVGLFTSTEDF